MATKKKKRNVRQILQDMRKNYSLQHGELYDGKGQPVRLVARKYRDSTRMCYYVDTVYISAANAIWTVTHGEVPDGHIQFVDGNKNNFDPANLRRSRDGRLRQMAKARKRAQHRTMLPNIRPTEPVIRPTEPTVRPTEPSVRPTEPSVPATLSLADITEATRKVVAEFIADGRLGGDKPSTTQQHIDKIEHQAEIIHKLTRTYGQQTDKLAKQEQRIAHQDAVISELTGAYGGHEAKILEQEQRIARRDASIREQQVRIRKQGGTAIHQDAELVILREALQAETEPTPLPTRLVREGEDPEGTAAPLFCVIFLATCLSVIVLIAVGAYYLAFDLL